MNYYKYNIFILTLHAFALYFTTEHPQFRIRNSKKKDSL